MFSASCNSLALLIVAQEEAVTLDVVMADAAVAVEADPDWAALVKYDFNLNAVSAAVRAAREAGEGLPIVIDEAFDTEPITEAAVRKA